MKILAFVYLFFLKSLAFSTNDKVKCEITVTNHTTFKQDGHIKIKISIENNTDYVLKYRRSPSSFGSIWYLRLCANNDCYYEEHMSVTESFLLKSDYKSISSKSKNIYNVHVDLDKFTNEKGENFLNQELSDKKYLLILKYSDNIKKGKKIINSIECVCEL